MAPPPIFSPADILWLASIFGTVFLVAGIYFSIGVGTYYHYLDSRRQLQALGKLRTDLADKHQRAWPQSLKELPANDLSVIWLSHRSCFTHLCG